MNSRAELMAILEKSDDWVASQLLSKLLQVTTRTIRTIVKEINMEYQSDPLILSSHKGYRINQVKLPLHCTADLQELGELPRDRLSKIVQFLIKAKTTGIHIFELSEQLFVSESTIRLDMKKVKEKIEPYCLDIICQSDCYFLIGSERDKRKLIKDTLYEEAEHSFYDVFLNQEFMLDQELEKIHEVITNVFASNQCTMNEYAYSNLVLHILIVIDRLRTNNLINGALQEKEALYKSQEYHMAKQILQELEAFFNIIFPEEEIYFLSLVLIGNMTRPQLIANEDFNLSELIGKEEVNLLDTIIMEVNRVYLIDLDTQEFKLRFLLHLENLIARSRNQCRIFNPMLHELKLRYPLTYDMAVFITDIIQKQIDLHINDDEIGFIAIHIGTHIENQKHMENKLKGILICPRYHNLHKAMLDKLESAFHQELIIMSVVTELSDGFDLSDIDLIISTMKYEMQQDVGFVQVMPFLGTTDLQSIQNVIAELQYQKKLGDRIQLIHKFIKKNMFFRNLKAESKEELIDLLGDKMKQNQYVDDCYMKSVHEREQTSSTAFHNVAVPHSVRMDALESVIGIVIYDKAFSWDVSKVDIVVMIAINNEDRELFGDILELFIQVLSDYRNLHDLKITTSYEDFMALLIKIISLERY